MYSVVKSEELTSSKRPQKNPAVSLSSASVFGAVWRSSVAEKLGVSRSRLRLGLLGLSKTDRDIDSELIFLIGRERAAAGSRGLELTALRHALIAASNRKSDVKS